MSASAVNGSSGFRLLGVSDVTRGPSLDDFAGLEADPVPILIYTSFRTRLSCRRMSCTGHSWHPGAVRPVPSSISDTCSHGRTPQIGGGRISNLYGRDEEQAAIAQLAERAQATVARWWGLKDLPTPTDQKGGPSNSQAPTEDPLTNPGITQRHEEHVRRGLARGLGAGESAARSVPSVRSRVSSVHLKRPSGRNLLTVRR